MSPSKPREWPAQESPVTSSDASATQDIPTFIWPQHRPRTEEVSIASSLTTINAAAAGQDIPTLIWARAEEVSSASSTTTTPAETTDDARESVSSDIQATIGVTVFAGCVSIAVGGWFLRKHMLARKKRKQEAEEAEAAAAGTANDETPNPSDDFDDALGKRPELEGSPAAVELSGVVALQELEVVEKPVELGGTPRAELETCWNDASTWSALQQSSPISPTIPDSSIARSPTVVASPSSSSSSATVAVAGTSAGGFSFSYTNSLRLSPFADHGGALVSPQTSLMK
ncbi:hypothetical protein VTJ49DRAFT_5521 [Mycothermus thermophilus]|uniref:Uncharacterized protein n=1 Tax=Humicola insolens TaxID=85995 RepID=A0ABR3VKY4_HUMIN